MKIYVVEEFITLKNVKKWVPYKDNGEFFPHLIKRDAESYAKFIREYYGSKNIKTKLRVATYERNAK